MPITNIMYCFEDRNERRCWAGFLMKGLLHIDAVERFVKVLSEYSEAGLRQIQVVGCERLHPAEGQTLKDVRLYEEQRLYAEPCSDDVVGLVKYLGKLRIEERNDVGRWDIFIPAMLSRGGENGVADVPQSSGYGRSYRKAPRATIKRPIVNRILDAFAELYWGERQELEPRRTEFLTAKQGGYVLKYGDLRFPIAQPTESPIEDIFWERAQHEISGLVPQYEIGTYRVDFALPEQQIAIELDGYRHHTPVEHRLNDLRRERDLMTQGWRVVRFLGTEVHQDLEACITQLTQIAGLEKREI